MGNLVSLDKEAMFDKFGFGGFKHKKKLIPSQVDCIKRCTSGFVKTIEKNCDSHFLYRANISMDDTVLHLVMVGTDPEGSIKELGLSFDYDSEEIGLYGGLEIKDMKAVIDSLTDMIEKMMKKIPFEVGMLDIPLVGQFVSGDMCPYGLEKDTVLMFIDNDDATKNFLI